MNISLEEYTKEVAKAMGNDFGIEYKDKTNGIVVCGIARRRGNEGATTKPLVYANGLYRNEVEVEEAAKILLEQYIKMERENKVDMSFVTDFEKAKGYLRALLLNKKTKAEVQKSATEYGFDDLIIVPYLCGIKAGEQIGKIKVPKELIKDWGVTEEEVFAIAEENSTNDSRVNPMLDTLSEIMGVPKEFLVMQLEANGGKESDFDDVLIVSNKVGYDGAYGIIAKRKEIAERFKKTGFVVLPSSIHEVIVMPNNGRIDEMTEMVEMVNGGYLDELEQLSDHAYEFVA